MFAFLGRKKESFGEIFSVRGFEIVLIKIDSLI